MAEPQTPPPVQLKALIASYPKLNDTTPSSWFAWSKDAGIKPKSCILEVCHSDMRYTEKGYDYLVTAVPKSDKISLRYLRMLIHGPFKAFSDLISLVRVKENYYLQCSELEKWPANILYNFCIASRAPIEFECYIEEWQRLVGEGYPELLAYLMSQSTAGKPFKNKRRFPDHGHHWFDPSSDWKNILNGTPKLTCESYHKSPASVTPSNSIWGKSEDHTVIGNLDDIETARYFGFVHPPKPAPHAKRMMTGKDAMYKAILGVHPAGQAPINEVLAAWNNPIAPPQPFNIIVEDEQPEPDFDDFPDFQEDDDD